MRGAVAADAAEQDKLRQRSASEEERRAEVVDARAFRAVAGVAPTAAAAMGSGGGGVRARGWRRQFFLDEEETAEKVRSSSNRPAQTNADFVRLFYLFF